jgi:hypothetical protein
MNRRDFVSLSSLGIMCGSAMGRCARAAACPAGASLESEIGGIAVKPIDARIKVKPLCVSLVHTCAYEGPCRDKGLTPEVEAPRASEEATRFVNSLKAGISKEAVLMEPALLQHDETFTLGPQEWRKL